MWKEIALKLQIENFQTAFKQISESVIQLRAKEEANEKKTRALKQDFQILLNYRKSVDNK